jgi:hypothetical protein
LAGARSNPLTPLLEWIENWPAIRTERLAEAIQYRTLDRNLWR